MRTRLNEAYMPAPGVPAASGRAEGALPAADLPDLRVDPRHLLEAAGSDTILVSETGALLAARDAKSPLMEALETGNWSLGDGLSWAAFRDELRMHARETRPLSRRVILARRSGPPESLSYDLIGVPVDAGRQRALLVVANETTLERNLVKALIASRQLFRDLVACSADFAWETDAAGIFTYISNSDAAGFTAHALNGRQAKTLLGSSASGDVPSLNPFSTREPIHNAEVWVWGQDGRRRCMIVSAVPVKGDEGDYQGARGVCRDVTSLREQDAEIANAREREAKVEKAVSAIRREIAPDDILTATATALLEASEAGACLVLGTDCEGKLDPEHQAWSVTSEFGQLAIWSERGAVTKTLLEQLDALPTGSDTPHALRVEALGCLALVASHQGRRTGAICLMRPDPGDVAPWPASALSTLRMLNPSVSLALAQAAHMRSLETLSRTDGLTGSLNRRSFETDVRRRIAEARGEGLDGALMYLDFDGFKTVNDTMGHAQGDTVLREFGDRARKLLRAGDIFARLGGDEFAIWLHGVNEKGAEVAGERLCEAGRKLRAELELPDAFSVSAGIALFDPEAHETLEQLEARADSALYAAKRGGKDGWSMAGAPSAEQPGRMQC